jgi:hypothetical protein
LDINLFSRIVKKLGDTNIEDFECTIDSKIYGFKDIGDNTWDDQGKYQYKYEQGQLIEMDKKYNEIQSFNFGVSRTVQRSGSYFSDYYYEHYPYEYFEIKEILIPEKIIPAHTENQWNKLVIDLNNIVDEEEEERKRLEAEKIKLEEEAKVEKERLIKLYPMNKQEIIKIVNKNLKKKGIKFTIQNMRKEYFDIVVSKNLESQEWIDYHKSIFENM